MSAICQVTGRKPSFGKTVSHSHRRTSRRWNPNVQRKKFYLASEGRTITLLPACPQAWDKGSVKGLRARGNVTVDIDWTLSANSLAATLSSPTGGTFDIVFGDRQQTVQLPQGKKVSVKF